MELESQILNLCKFFQKQLKSVGADFAIKPVGVPQGSDNSELVGYFNK